MCEKLILRQAIIATLVIPLCAALNGCNGRAHSDVYRQRMASEIRVLEDQLYEADYENRMLRDKLKRELSRQATPPQADLRSGGATAAPSQPPGEPSGERLAPPEPPPAEKPDDAATPPSPSRTPPSPKPSERSQDGQADRSDQPDRTDDMGADLETTDELSLPDFDEGVPVDPAELTDPFPTPVPDTNSDQLPLPPAPGGPEPPGKRDTELLDVEPGLPLPPPVSEEDEVKPPGQIKLPDTLSGAGVPMKIRVHAGLSGGDRVDGEIDEVTIVVNAIDKYGKTVDLSEFDVDAELSVVVLDPDRDSAEARLGRWDFDNRQVATLIRDEPISGLHIPLPWNDIRPSGEEIIVHVRLRAEDDEMRCQGRIKVDRESAIAQWTPRGEKLR